MNTEVVFIDADATEPLTSAAFTLDRGVWQIAVDTADTSASIAVQKRKVGGTNYGVVARRDAALALSTADPFAKVDANGNEQFQVVRTGGTLAVTVIGTRVGDI